MFDIEVRCFLCSFWKRFFEGIYRTVLVFLVCITVSESDFSAKMKDYKPCCSIFKAEVFNPESYRPPCGHLIVLRCLISVPDIWTSLTLLYRQRFFFFFTFFPKQKPLLKMTSCTFSQSLIITSVKGKIWKCFQCACHTEEGIKRTNPLRECCERHMTSCLPARHHCCLFCQDCVQFFSCMSAMFWGARPSASPNKMMLHSTWMSDSLKHITCIQA